MSDVDSRTGDRAEQEHRDDRKRARRDGRALPDDDLRSRVQQIAVRQESFERYLTRELAVDVHGLRAMDHLLTSGPTTPTRLAERLGISTAALSLVTQRLEAAGHVTKARHPQDGRKIVVTPASASAARAEELVAPLIEGVGRLIADMSVDEQRVVQSFLDRLLGVYDDVTP
ncbi:MarR family winged helix-turn-helix transcriptional regulator [Frigoribacterium sp. 2-23]|uniref:MarR family winged helix-turn-helix transcriptional regulator n=1 Tax=Frigoribacterium sp. 2-23 TaxID=3415006 RepID=UPI003C6F42B6